jgi:hypothetical protein
MSVGAKVAITVSFKERVDCLICLGLQLQGIAGNTADAVDMRDLLQLKPPTLFAIGSQSWLSPVPKMEQIRLQMIARNKLVIVREADENLRIPLSKRLKVKMTQAMSDQLVLNEIGLFVQDTLVRLQSTEQENLAAPVPVSAAAPAAPAPVATPAPVYHRRHPPRSFTTLMSWRLTPLLMTTTSPEGTKNVVGKSRAIAGTSTHLDL